MITVEPRALISASKAQTRVGQKIHAVFTAVHSLEHMPEPRLDAPPVHPAHYMQNANGRGRDCLQLAEGRARFDGA